MTTQASEDFSPNLDLPFLLDGQAGKTVAVNESLLTLDALVQLVVEGVALTVPSSPDAGARWIVGPGAAGGFLGHEGSIAAWQDGAFQFYDLPDGAMAWDLVSQMILVRTTSGWQPFDDFLTGFDDLTGLGVGMTASISRPLSVMGDGVLFTADVAGTGDMRVVVNRAGGSDTASLLFQTGFSGRAEMGLTGSDDLTFRTSDDGTTFRDRIIASADGEQLTFLSGAGWSDGVRFCDVSDGRLYATCRMSGAGHGVFELHRNDNGSAVQGFSFHANGDCWIDNGFNRLGIGTRTPTVSLQASGAIRPGQFTVATLPSAAASGPGALVFVTDASGGAALAVCDGVGWRHVSDGSVIS